MIIVVAMGGLYLISPEYLRNTVIYQYPDIDDYKIFDNRTVIAGSRESWKEAPGLKNKEIVPGHEEILTRHKTKAFLVIKEGKIIFEKYYEPFTSDYITGAFSMSKSIISLLVGIAIDQGSIESVDQPVGDFIPRFSDGRLGEITIRHLLEMSSGLSWKDSYWNPFSITARAYYGNNLSELAVDQEVVRDPGKYFDYKNGNTQLLAMVVEKAAGLSVSAYASVKLWKPMGAGNDAYWSLDDVNGIEKAFCGFNANARDFARFGKLILDKGLWNGKRLISEDYLNNALKPADHLTDRHDSPVHYYGWQWWIHQHNGEKVYSMRGLKGQYVFIIPGKDVVIVRLGEKTSKKMIDNVMPSDVPEYINTGLYFAEGGN